MESAIGSYVAASDVERWRRDGFVVLPEPIVDGDGLQEVAALLDPLFAPDRRLPAEWTKDLTGDADAPIPEVWHATRLVPALTESAAYRNCQSIAEQLLGWDVSFLFDHAIYKRRGADVTDWHQDLANAPPGHGHPTAHFWFPLDDADEDNGCMRFVPRSQTWGLLPHHPRTPGSNVLVTEIPAGSVEVACPVPAGTPTVHQRGTLHSAGANHTDRIRRVWVIQFVARPPRWRRAIAKAQYQVRTVAGR